MWYYRRGSKKKAFKLEALLPSAGRLLYSSTIFHHFQSQYNLYTVVIYRRLFIAALVSYELIDNDDVRTSGSKKPLDVSM